MNAFPRWLKLSLALALLALVAGGIWFYGAQEREMRREVENNLNAIAQLKVNQIADWRADQIGEGDELTASRFFARGVAQWLSDPQAKSPEEILSRFRSLQNHYLYQDVLLVDTDRRVRLSLNGRVAPLETESARVLSAALRERKPLLSDLHIDELCSSPHISVVAPIFVDEGENQKPIGAVVLICDMRQFLYPLLQSWPTPSQTAETLLIRRDGSDVLFLNDLRHQKDTALKLRIPLTQTNVPAVMAVLGKEGIVRGTDYRGVEVISAIKRIPDSPWFLVAKMDVSEAFADWRFESVFMLALLMALMASVGAIGFVIWQRNQKAHYQALYRAEAERLASEMRYGITLKSIGDAVIVTDAKGRVELLNPVAETLTGWTDEKARGRPLEEVFHIINEETRQLAENPVTRVIREGVVVGLANHTVLIARDGTERPIADAGAPIRDEKNEIIGVVLVFREQTEERAIQRALRENERKYRELVQNANSIILRWNAKGCITFLNEFGQTFFGYTEPEILGKHVVGTIAPETDSTGRHLRPLIEQILTNPDSFTHNVNENIRRDGRRVWVSWYNKAIYDAQGRFVEVLSIGNDITDRRRAEETLRESEERYRALFEGATEGFYRSTPTGRYVLANPALARMLGYTSPRELIASITDIERQVNLDPSLRAEFKRRIEKDGEVRALEFQVRRKDGRAIWVSENAHAVRDKNGTVLCYEGTIEDITERKQAEAALRESQGLLRSLVEQLPAGVFRKDKEGRYVFVNSWFCRFKGVEADFYWGKTPEEMEAAEVAKWGAAGRDHPRLGAQGARHHEMIMRTGRPVEVDEEWPGLDGKMHHFHVVKSPVFDLDGNIVGTQGIQFDITERKQAETALRESEQEFRTLAEAMPQIVWATRPDGWNIYFNQRWVDYTGLTLEESYGHGWNIPFHPDDRQRAWDAWQNATQNEATYSLECRLRRADGVYRWWLIRGVPLRDADGTIIKWFGTCTDIEDIKQAETGLGESRQMLQTVLNTVPVRVFWKDTEGRYLGCNEPFARDAGFDSPEKMMGKNDYDMGWKEQADLYRADDRQVITSGVPKINYEEPQTTPAGTRMWLRTSKIPLRDLEGRIIGVLGTYEDITERKRAEEKLRERMEELLAWENVTLGREGRIIELKKEVNELLAKQGKPPRYREPEEGTSSSPP